MCIWGPYKCHSFIGEHITGEERGLAQYLRLAPEPQASGPSLYRCVGLRYHVDSEFACMSKSIQYANEDFQYWTTFTRPSIGFEAQ